MNFRKPLIGVDPLQRTGPESDLVCGMSPPRKSVSAGCVLSRPSRMLAPSGSEWKAWVGVIMVDFCPHQ